jgi:UDP-2,4-diacetamido-2,4,6-trideoxy-beta-L-altropyranose hydrolase
MKNILFRADSSSTIGTGHITRDLVLAQKYAKKGDNIIFATQNLDGNINHKIIEAGYELQILKSNKFKELNRLIKKLKIDKIAIDHYGIDYKFEKQLKKQNKDLKILSFDDIYEKHYCDILLNHNISGDKKRYKNLVPKNCKLRCGAKYTLLRDEFINEKNKNCKPNKKFIIFIAMGGADTANLNIKILKVLSGFKNIKVHIVTTMANKYLKELKKYSQNKDWIKLHINSTKIAKLMRKSDLAIVTPSVTLNEIYFMDVPFIAIKTADNQNDMYDYITKEKKFVLKKFNKNKLESIVNDRIN